RQQVGHRYVRGQRHVDPGARCNHRHTAEYRRARCHCRCPLPRWSSALLYLTSGPRTAATQDSPHRFPSPGTRDRPRFDTVSSGCGQSRPVAEVKRGSSVSTVQFKRPPRMPAPRTPGGEVHLEPPPEIPRNIPGNVVQKILPFVMILATLGMVACIFTAMRDRGGVNPFFLMMPVMMLVSMGGMFLGGGRGGAQKKAEMNEDRKDYLRYLGQMRERAHQAMREQHAALEWVHPHPSTLLTIAGSRRMWERRACDRDILAQRVGEGSYRPARRVGAAQPRHRAE